VNAICYGAQLMIPGILRFEQDIEATRGQVTPKTLRRNAQSVGYGGL
jgi:predicted ribosome-associated RNA-binding protein Tma20